MTSLFPEDERAPQPPINRDEVPQEISLNFGQLLDWFTPNVLVCWAFLGINVVVYLAMLLLGSNPDSASSQTLLKWGADFGPATITRGEWWRVVTSLFVHLGIIHLACNMYVLAQIGPFMERLLGNIGFALVYLIAGIAGSFCSLAWHPFVISVGASGAIFGLYGALVGFLILRRDSIPSAVLSSLLTSAGVFVLYNAVFGFLREGTDIAAHVGGFLGGLLCGLVVSNPITPGFPQRRLKRAAAAVACVAMMFAEKAILPRPVDFQGEMKKFADTESKVLDTYKAILSGPQTKDEQVIAQIQTQILKPWNAEQKSLNALTGLPIQQQHLVNLLLNYMDGREHAWNTVIQGLRAHNPDMVRQSMQQQLQAQTTLKTAMDASH